MLNFSVLQNARVFLLETILVSHAFHEFSDFPHGVLVEIVYENVHK